MYLFERSPGGTTWSSSRRLAVAQPIAGDGASFEYEVVATYVVDPQPGVLPNGLQPVVLRGLQVVLELAER